MLTTYAKYLLRAQLVCGSTTIGAAGAGKALQSLKDLHDRGMVSVTVTDQTGRAWSVVELHGQVGIDNDRLKLKSPCYATADPPAE